MNQVQTQYTYEKSLSHSLLNTDICGKIFSYLGLLDLVTSSYVCKLWNSVASKFYLKSFNNDLFRYEFIRKTTTPLITREISYDIPVEIHFKVCYQTENINNVFDQNVLINPKYMSAKCMMALFSGFQI